MHPKYVVFYFFFLVFPYFSTSNRIGIILNWKLRQCVAVEDKIYKAVQMNSCGGKNYLTVSCKMYRNILLHSQIGYRILISIKVVIFGILILFIIFRTGSLFQNHVSISSEISSTFSNDKSQNYVPGNMCIEERS